MECNRALNQYSRKPNRLSKERNANGKQTGNVCRILYRWLVNLVEADRYLFALLFRQLDGKEEFPCRKLIQFFYRVDPDLRG